MPLEMLPVVRELPPATRALTLGIAAFSALLFLLRITLSEVHPISWHKDDSAVGFPWLVLVPGASFWYPWTLLTASFCETSWIELLVTLVSIPLMGRYFEQLWGPIELLKFAFVVLVGSNLIAWAAAILQFALLRTEFILYATQYHGMTALQTGFLVGFTQMIPEHRVQLFHGRVTFQVKNLPMAYVTLSTVLCLLGVLSPWILIQFGWLLSWVYLRFVKYNDAAGFRGDRSETFAFVNWFPPFLHTPIGLASNFAHGIFTRLHLIQPWEYTDLESGNALNAGLTAAAAGGGGQSAAAATPFTPSGPPRAEAERRRAMALKALDQKMASGNRAPPSSSSVPGSPASASGSGPNSARGPHSARSKLGAAPAPGSNKVLFSAEDDEGETGAPSGSGTAAGLGADPSEGGTQHTPPDLLGNEQDEHETADLLTLGQQGKDFDEGDIGTSTR